MPGSTKPFFVAQPNVHTCPCAHVVTLLDSAERIFHAHSRGADIGNAVTAWMAERDKMCPDCPSRER